MDTREFLQAVIPWDTDGFTPIHWHRPETDGFFGRSCQSVDAAMVLISELKAKTEFNIYFCISRQRVGYGKRNRNNALGLVCIPIDLDIKPDSPNHYPTLAEAIASLLWFCDKVGIPRPSILVASGGGLHGYWLSNRVMLVEEWQPYADAIKNVAKLHGLKFDAVCTGDAARVLRVPETSNWKYGAPRSVRLIQAFCPGTRHDFAEAFKPILDQPVTPTPIPAGEIADVFKTVPVEPLAEGIEFKEIPPLPIDPILPECAWLREAFETGGANYDEPQWNMTTLLATYLENDREMAHQLGNQHPNYTIAETDKKFDYKLHQRKLKSIGWPTCKAIANAGSTHCNACKHFGKIKSPLNISYSTLDSVETVEELGGEHPPEELRLPEGFCVDKLGRICAIVPAKRTGKNTVHPARVLNILLSIISSPTLQFQNGRYGIGFVVQTDRFGEAEVFLHSGQTTLRSGLVPYLHERCVLTNTEKGASEMIEKFAISWLDKLLKSDVAVRDHGTMGWRYQDSERVGFVYGNMLYCTDGTNRPIMASADDDFRSWYMPVGSRDVWLNAAKLLTDRKRPELDIIIAIGFAAPLMTFAGTLYGAIISTWGPPGTSKSTAQQVAAAIWGHPKLTRESLTSTPKSVQRRLGLCRNLAAYWDDIQDERHQDALFQTMFVATQGAEGGRLNVDSTMKERLEWQTLMVACSNASFVEYLIKKQKSTTAGMRRVFEIEFNKKEDGNPGMINATDAGRVFAALERNYGVIATEYSKLLATEHETLDQLVADTTKVFCESVAGDGDEAYWWGTCGVLLVGAALANRLGAQLDVPAMEAFLRQAFEYNRNIRSTEGTEGGTYRNTELGLTAFMNFYVGSGNVIYIDRLFQNRHTGVQFFGSGPPVGHPIYVQVVRDERKIIFSKREMREFFAKHQIDARQVLNGLTKYFGGKENRHTLGAGTVFAQTQELCIELTLEPNTPHVLTDLLQSHGMPVDA